MTTAPPDMVAHEPKRSRWQFSLRRMFIAITAIAILFGLAAAGGGKSDAVVYLAVAVVAGVFSPAARRALLGACTILGAFWLALFLGEMAFGSQVAVAIRGRCGYLLVS